MFHSDSCRIVVDTIRAKSHIFIWACIGTVTCGLLAQGMALLNKYSFHDDVIHMNAVGATYQSGRWMLGLLQSFIMRLFQSSNFSLPLYNGVISILLLAIVACVLTWTLGIRRAQSAFVLGAILVACPVLTSTFAYMFTAPYYMLSFLLAVSGAVMTLKLNNHVIACTIGAAMLAMSMGIYQSYLSVFVSVLVMNGILKSLGAEQISRQWLAINLIRPLVTAACGVLAYYVFMRVSLSVYGLELDSYMGINTMGITSLGGYLRRIRYAYRDFLLPRQHDCFNIFVFGTSRLYIVTVLSDAILCMAAIVSQARRCRHAAVLCVVACLLLPLAANLPFVTSEPNDVHTLMVYSKVTPLILLVVLLENVPFKNTLRTAVHVVGTLTLSLILVSWVRYDNACLLKMELAQTQAISWSSTLVTRIQSVKGYKDDLPVTFINRVYDKDEFDSQSLTRMPAFDSIETVPYTDLKGMINDFSWRQFVSQWTGYSPRIAFTDELDVPKEVSEMPQYPNDGAIAVIDGVIYVKF